MTIGKAYDTRLMDGFQRVSLMLLIIAMMVAALTRQHGFLWAMIVAIVIGTIINIVRIFWNV